MSPLWILSSHPYFACPEIKLLCAKAIKNKQNKGSYAVVVKKDNLAELTAQLTIKITAMLVPKIVELTLKPLADNDIQNPDLVNDVLSEVASGVKELPIQSQDLQAKNNDVKS